MRKNPTRILAMLCCTLVLFSYTHIFANEPQEDYYLKNENSQTKGNTQSSSVAQDAANHISQNFNEGYQTGFAAGQATGEKVSQSVSNAKDKLKESLKNLSEKIKSEYQQGVATGKENSKKLSGLYKDGVAASKQNSKKLGGLYKDGVAASKQNSKKLGNLYKDGVAASKQNSKKLGNLYKDGVAASKQNSKKLGALFQNGKPTAQQNFQKLGNLYKDGVAASKENSKKLGSLYKDGLAASKENTKKVTQMAKDFVDWAKNFASKVFDVVKRSFSSAVQWVSGRFNDLGVWVRGQWQKLTNTQNAQANKNQKDNKNYSKTNLTGYLSPSNNNYPTTIENDNQDFDSATNPIEDNNSESYTDEQDETPEFQADEFAFSTLYRPEVEIDNFQMIINDLIEDSLEISEYRTLIRQAGSSSLTDEELDLITYLHDSRENNANLVANLIIRELEDNQGKPDQYYSLFKNTLSQLERTEQRMISDVVQKVRESLQYQSTVQITPRASLTYKTRLLELSKF